MKSFELFSLWLSRHVTSRAQNHFDVKESLPLRITWIDTQWFQTFKKLRLTVCIKSTRWCFDQCPSPQIYLSTFIISLSVVWHQSRAGMNYIESFTAFFHHCWTNIHDNRLHSIGSFVNMTVVNASLVSTKAPQSLLFFIINWSLNEIKESLQVMDWTVWWSLLYAPKSMLILREISYAPLWYQSWKREINFFKVWKSISKTLLLALLAKSVWTNNKI